jgi:hypothetical protein
MRLRIFNIRASLGFMALFCGAAPILAQATMLGSAQSFAVLAGSAVTNTGPSVIAGDLSVWPGTAVTGFPPGLVVAGTTHVADGVALQAQSDVTTAYNALAGLPSGQDLTGQDLGGLTLVPGVYSFSTSAQLTGTLTLDTQGNPNALFVFQIGSTLTTASNSTVASINGPNLCNLYWQVGSSATLGTGTSFQGNILALASITMDTGATLLDGRALARNGAVTLDSVNATAGCTCVFGPTSADCNANGIPDECDIAGGTSLDCNHNGIPDECDLPSTMPEFSECAVSPWASIGVPISFQICANSGSGGSPITLTLFNSLPQGATLTPPLPLVGNNVCTTFNWTPTLPQAGYHVLEFFAMDGNGCSTQCKMRVVTVQTLLVLGPSYGSSQFVAQGHLFDAQISPIRRFYPVSAEVGPSFAYSRLPVQYSAQVLMFSPLFPAQPFQWSHAVEFTKSASGLTMDSQPFGTMNRISLSVETYTDALGQLRVRFPFQMQ